MLTGSTLALGLAAALGYLLGSIPFGLVLTRLAGLGDVRAIGSGNIGATNVLRTGNKGLAAATLLLDAAKGTAAVLIAERFIGAPVGYAILASLIAGLAAFIGHIAPVWLGFKGGKGVATYIGILAGLAWPYALLFCGVWLVIAFVTRYSSLSALVASSVVPLALWIGGIPYLAALFLLLTVLLFWKHRANIERLRAGTEGKIGAKA